MKAHSLILLLVLSGLVLSAQAQTIAKKTQSPFDLEVTAGATYDSNVSINEIDSETAQSDTAFNLAGRIVYAHHLNKRTKINLRGSWSQRSYNDFSQYDLLTNLFSAQLQHDFGGYKLAAGLRHIATDLDSQDFLNFDQAALTLSSRLSKTIFIRSEYTYTDKQFKQSASRDTDEYSIGTDLYYFLDGSRQYWSFGYKYQDENTVNEPQFSRQIHSLKTKYHKKFQLFSRDTKFSLKGRYQIRNYDAITPSIGEVRDDDRLRFGVELQIPINLNWFVRLEYEFFDYSSNLPSADYSQNIVAMKIGWHNQG